MKRTRKWAFVAQEATRLAELGLSAVEIARRLEVNRSTVSRWMKAGKLGVTRVTGDGQTQVVRQTPAEWAAAVRAEYSLDATDDQLVTLAEQALEVAFRSFESVPSRLGAMGRFQAIVKQLALVARTPAAQQTPEEPKAKPPERVPRRLGEDPRRGLMAVVNR